MKVLIIDTDKWSDNFAYAMGKHITQSNKGGVSVNTPSHGNTGYGQILPKTEDGYTTAKAKVIEYIRANELTPILTTLDYYKNTRANVDYYLSEQNRILEKIKDLENRDVTTFLPYNVSASVLIDLSHNDDITEFEERAIEYCALNNINLVGFRYEEEAIKKDEPKILTVSDRTDLKVLVKEYKGRLIIETINPEDDNDIDFIGNNGSVIGCVLNNLKRLGVSAEAFIILCKMKKVGDAIGDLCGEKHNFSWIGRRNTILGPKIVGSRYYKVPSSHIMINNEIPEEVIKIIDEAEKGKDIDYKDVPFSLWIEFNKETTYVDGKYESSGVYLTSFCIHEKHYYDENIRIINAPEKAVKLDDGDIDVKASTEAKHDIADLIFHNILGEKLRVRVPEKVLAEGEEESETDKLLRKFRELDGFGYYNKYTYSHKVKEEEMWDYVNSFFDLGFSNNIMNPRDDYFRLSINGTIDELKELLSQFKLVK